ncbi:MAG: divalent metal cation transporter [Planctomycetia bacterium]|nr:divalent metal cation transporter [Planctomycetia bacterium]
MTTQNEKVTQPEGGAGLPMSPKWDPERLAAERAELKNLETLPLGRRSLGYIKRTGPGLLQSAMTLGAGSATASVLAGASFGYKLLWVQPLAMFFGVLMLGALSNVVLTKGERPYSSFGKEIWKPLVWLWAIGTILSSVIWHFPQYALLAGAGRDLASLSGMSIVNEGATPGWIQSLSDLLTPLGFSVNTSITTLGYLVSFGVGAFILCMNIIVVFNYGKGGTGIKIYERFLRTMIALVIVFFLIVCVGNINKVNWLEILRGFTGYYGFPKNPETGMVDSATYLQVLGMLGAAVGINMTFLYPYSLLAKGWGAEHKMLARWDLGMTMFLPFCIVTSLIIISMTVTGVYDGVDGVRTGLAPLAAAEAFKGIPGGRAIFCLGLMGMCGGAVSTHMVACGFTLGEMLGVKMTRNRFRLFALTPCIGVLGVVIALPMWFPVVASAVCFTMLPIAYFIFFYLNNKKSYIGDATGKGYKRVIFNFLLILALLFSVVGSAISIQKNVIDKLRPKQESNVGAPEVVEHVYCSDLPAEEEQLPQETEAEGTEVQDVDVADVAAPDAEAIVDAQSEEDELAPLPKEIEEQE